MSFVYGSVSCSLLVSSFSSAVLLVLSVRFLQRTQWNVLDCDCCCLVTSSRQAGPESALVAATAGDLAAINPSNPLSMRSSRRSETYGTR